MRCCGSSVINQPFLFVKLNFLCFPKLPQRLQADQANKDQYVSNILGPTRCSKDIVMSSINMPELEVDEWILWKG